MKNNYSVAQRNAIVVEHLWCINAVIRQNRALMRTAGLDYDDVYQQLAIRLIRAVAGFDPDKGKLEQHIFAQLKFELLNCKTPYRLCGMTGLPKDYCKEKIIPLEAIQESCDLYEQAMTASEESSTGPRTKSGGRWTERGTFHEPFIFRN